MQAVVVPTGASSTVLALLSSTGWDLRAAGLGDVPEGGEPQAALRLAGPDRGLVFVPSDATVSSSLRRVVVLHDGTLASAPSVEAGDRIATSSNADLVVLYVADVGPAPEPGSLSAPRLDDHDPYDRQEWRDEFLRRFCPVSAGVSVTVELASGPPVTATLDVVARERADLLVVSWDGELDGVPAETLRGLMTHSPCPLLILRMADTATPGQGRRARPISMP